MATTAGKALAKVKRKDFGPASWFTPFIYCRKVNDLLSGLCRLRDKSGNGVVLRSYKEARTSKEVLILGVLEGVLARLELDRACTQFALTCPKEIKKSLNLWSAKSSEALSKRC